MSDSATPRHTNHLIGETSPYLLQHAHNPVDWHPWGEEALRKAAREDKPIFLSIGYAACHWCHVMEHESFEDESIAALLNAQFVSIKVDREERPDLDAIYMSAVQMLTGQGGWPMSVFLTPDGRPFYGGTYFPPEDRWGRPGFRTVLQSIARSWTEEREKILKNGQALFNAIGEMAALSDARGAAPPDEAILERAAERLAGQFDRDWGGFGGAPKFPPSAALALLLREHARTGAPEALAMVEKTLDAMARGGMYDQLGGGFHRYATDAHWLVPHFEKMLYDNALLAPVYFDAWLVTGNEAYRRIGLETLDYLLAEMVTESGGLASAQDADSEGVEGRYYVWTPAQVRAALGDGDDATLFMEFYDVRAQGNWDEGEGASILNVPQPLDEFSARRGMAPEDVHARLQAARRRLLAVRRERIPPLKDDKVLAAWNGLAVSALARGTQVSGDPRYAAAARRAMDSLLVTMRTPDGGLLRASRNGQARIDAFLEDYASVIVGLIDLYETVFDPALLAEADRLAARMIERFADREGVGFFSTDGRDPSLIARLKDFYDGATPSGNALAVHALWRLGRLLGRDDDQVAARRVLEQMAEELRDRSPAYHHLLCALADVLGPGAEIVVIGPAGDAATDALVSAAWRTYSPGRLIIQAEEGRGDWPLIEGRTMPGGRPAAYVCHDGACQAPVTEPAALRAQLTGR